MKLSKMSIIFLTIIMPLIIGVAGSYLTSQINIAEIKTELTYHKERLNKFEARVDKQFDKFNKIVDKIFSDIYKPHISMTEKK